MIWDSGFGGVTPQSFVAAGGSAMFAIFFLLFFLSRGLCGASIGAAAPALILITSFWNRLLSKKEKRIERNMAEGRPVSCTRQHRADIVTQVERREAQRNLLAPGRRVLTPVCLRYQVLQRGRQLAAPRADPSAVCRDCCVHGVALGDLYGYARPLAQCLLQVDTKSPIGKNLAPTATTDALRKVPGCAAHLR